MIVFFFFFYKRLIRLYLAIVFYHFFTKRIDNLRLDPLKKPKKSKNTKRRALHVPASPIRNLFPTLRITYIKAIHCCI